MKVLEKYGWLLFIIASIGTCLILNSPMVVMEANEPPPEVAYVIKEKTAPDMIIEECIKYGIDPTIPLAIATLETGHFGSQAFLEGNNVGGLSIQETPLVYSTLEEGVDAHVKNLAENYFAQGLDTVEEIGAKYCPVNRDIWIDTVNALIEESKYA